MKRSRHSRSRGTSRRLAGTFVVVSIAAVAFAIGLLPYQAVRDVAADPAASRLNMAELLDLLLHPKAFTEVTVAYPPDLLNVIVPAGEANARLTVVAESNDPDNTTTIGIGIDAAGIAPGTQQYTGGLYGPAATLDEANLLAEEPFFTTIPLSFIAPLLGIHEMYALGDVGAVFGSSAYTYSILSEPVYFNVTEEPATSDYDDDGLPDDPFNIIGSGSIWVATGASGREVVVANLDPGLTAKAVPPAGTGVPVLMGNLTVVAPTTQDLITAGLVEADSEVLLIVAGDDDLEGLLDGDTDWADSMLDALPSDLVPIDEDPELGLKQFFEISIIYTVNGGTEYRELEALAPDVPVLVTMDSLEDSANGEAAALWSFDTEIRDDVVDSQDVMVIGEVPGARWSKVLPYEILADNRIVAELTSLSVFAPFYTRIDVTNVSPGEGPHDETVSALISGTFLTSGTMSLAQAVNTYVVRFGSFIAAFDNSSGPPVTRTSMRVLVPARPDLSVTTTVDVTVTEVDDSLHTDTLEDAYIYAVSPPPTVNSVNPNAGPVAGGTAVTIVGSGFSEASGVTFDGIAGTDLVEVSNTQITVTTPAHAAGAVDVAVTAAGGTSMLQDAFTYVAVPQVLFIEPTEGPVTGGTEVTITGQNFANFGLQVAFGDEVASVVSQTSTKIVVTAPAQTAATVDVTVTTAGGTATLANAFTYNAVGAPPTITDISPTAGPATGGTTVTITGTNFDSLQVVALGGVPASITSATSTQLVVVTQPHAPGVVEVVVRTLNGIATKPSAFTYTAVGGAPTITSITPNTGPTAGGTGVTIRGTNLSTAQSVTFDSTLVTTLNIVSGTRINLITPAHNAGTVDVIVTTAGGQATLTGAFTFRDPRVNVFSVEPDIAWAFGGVVARIEGQGFTREATGDPLVTFGGVPALVLTATDEELLVVVPPQLLPDGSPAQNQVDVVVSKTVGGAAVEGTRGDAFIYQHFVKRNETFGSHTDPVITTAFYLEGGVGSHEILNGTAPSVAKGRLDAPAGLGIGDVGVLVRSSKSPAVFGLTNLSTGTVIPNVWYYDVHFYGIGGNVVVDPDSADAGDLAYEELTGISFDRGEPAPTLTFPVADTDLTEAELESGRVALFGLTAELEAQPVGDPDYSLLSTDNRYQSQPVADEFVVSESDEPVSIVSRIYQSGAFGLRTNVVPDLDALNLRLDETEHPDGVVEGPTSGGTRVVMVSDGGLGWVDRVTFVIDGEEVEAHILTEQGSNEFLLVVESPEVEAGGDADIRVYLLSEPDDPAGTLEEAFVYSGRLNPCLIATVTYGTPMASKINVLRAFRDTYMTKSELGMALVDTYYRVSPPIAKLLAARPALAALVRTGLVPVIALAEATLAAPYPFLGMLAMAGVAGVRVYRRKRLLAR